MLLKKTVASLGTILAIASGLGFADDLSSAPKVSGEPTLFGVQLTDVDERNERIDDAPTVDSISEEPIPAAESTATAKDAQPDCWYCQPPAAPPKPWKVLFYDNDFSDMHNPGHKHLLGEELKEMRADWLGCDGWISVGGELKFRHMNEYNRLRPGGRSRSTYDLWRWRHYIDVRYSDSLRGYIEMLDASIVHEDLPATGIDLNR